MNLKPKPVLLSLDGTPLRSQVRPDPAPTIPVSVAPSPYVGIPQLPRIDDAVFQAHLNGEDKRSLDDAAKRILAQNPLLLVMLNAFFGELDKSCILNASQGVPKNQVKFLLNVIMFATYDLLTAQLEKNLTAKPADSAPIMDDVTLKGWMGVDPAVPGEDRSVETPVPQTEAAPQ